MQVLHTIYQTNQAQFLVILAPFQNFQPATQQLCFLQTSNRQTTLNILKRRIFCDKKTKHTPFLAGEANQACSHCNNSAISSTTSRTFSGTHLNLLNGCITILVCCTSLPSTGSNNACEELQVPPRARTQKQDDDREPFALQQPKGDSVWLFRS